MRRIPALAGQGFIRGIARKRENPFAKGLSYPLANGAGNGARTRHLSLGKAALYQMSYSRKASIENGLPRLPVRAKRLELIRLIGTGT